MTSRSASSLFHGVTGARVAGDTPHSLSVRLDASKRMTSLQSVVTFMLQVASGEPIRRGDPFVTSLTRDVTSVANDSLCA